MAFDDASLISENQSLKARLATCKEQYEPILERYTTFKTNMGIKEKRDGSLQIDFATMVERLGPEQCAILRQVIDEKHGGAAGSKSPAEVLAPLVGKTLTVLASEGGKPKLRIHAAA